MPPISKERIVAFSTRLIVTVIVAKVLALGMLWFLPAEGVSQPRNESVQPPFRRYTLASMIAAPSAASKRASQSAAAGTSITDLVLKGLYGSGQRGFVIVALKSRPNDTEIVAVGEAYKNYTLTAVESRQARFTSGGKEYVLMLEDAHPLPAGSYRPPSDDSEPGLEPDPAPMDEPVEGAPQTLSRSVVEGYSKNLDKIWKDIGVQEVKEEEQITGFRITRIRNGSPFARLGLRNGDVIVKANNQSLDSYAKAMEIYQQIDSADALSLVVMRNNEEKEFVYEIR